MRGEGLEGVRDFPLSGERAFKGDASQGRGLSGEKFCSRAYSFESQVRAAAKLRARSRIASCPGGRMMAAWPLLGESGAYRIFWSPRVAHLRQALSQGLQLSGR